MEPATGGRDRTLAGTGMSATGIRPQAARVIFPRMPLLQHNAPLLIDQEDREGAMQQPRAVDGILTPDADRAVVFVDQDQRIIGHAYRH